MYKRLPSWLYYSIISILLMGVWGALIEIPEKRISPPFPTTLGYVVWALTMIPCALYALRTIHWNLDYSRRTIISGSIVGLLGAGGQLVCFLALKLGPAYIIFPIISLSPVITVFLSITLLKEKTHFIAYIGIAFSLMAIFFLSLQEPNEELTIEYTWLAFALGAFLMWGFQGYFTKKFLLTIQAESIFFYMTTGALILVPFAILLTDFSQPIGWVYGLLATLLIQFLNAAGALISIYAYRYGKAIIVNPTINGLTPFVAIVLSLIIYSRLPYYMNAIGMAFSLISIILITYGESRANADQTIK